MSPTAGIKSGIKGSSLCSMFIIFGVYLKEKNKKCYTVGDTFPAALTLGTKESHELAPIPSPHLLMYSKSSLISGDTCR